MNILSTSNKNDFAMQKDLFRLSATLFAETSNEYSSLDSQLQMIKCIFLKIDNDPMSVEEIAVQLLEIFKYHISENEVERIIKSQLKTFETVEADGVTSYKLLKSVFTSTKESQKHNIDYYIADFIKMFDIVDAETCSNAIYNYLYELTTTNINSYRLLIAGKSGLNFSDSELSVDISYLKDTEQQYIHDFIAWEDGDKNIALSNIVFTCLEYCLLVNGDRPNKLLANTIRKREIYLDTNIIFRALGINGPIRKRSVNAFLSKCNQAQLKLIISHNTRKEFFDTIDHYLEEIRRYPRGNIYPGAYEQLSNYTLFNLYEEWRGTHPSMSLNYFKMFIQSSYKKMVKEYAMIDDEKIPKSIYDSEQFKEVRNSYSATIKKIKDELRDRYIADDDRYSQKDSHDATVVHYVEMKREENQDSDLFFVSSDKILRYWDLSRPEKDYPVVIYPSQLFLVLIKICGRSENDFDSFVSFINVISAHHQMPAEKANAIICGISTITEDIKSQEILVSAICSGEYQDVIQNAQNSDELYEAVQKVCKRYLEEELKAKESKIASLQESASASSAKITTLEETAVEHEKEITSLRGQVAQQATDINAKNKTIDEKNKEISESKKKSEAHKEQICNFAEKKTRLGLILKWYVFPIVTALFCITYIAFLALQFVACDADWNFVTKIIEAIDETTFGKTVEGYIAIIDSGIFVFLTSIVIPNFLVKPWDKEKRNADKQKRIEKYIAKHKLL